MSAFAGLQVAAVEEDGRSRVLVSPQPCGWSTWFTGKGDDLVTPARGGGDQIRLVWTDVEDRGEKSIDVQFMEPVFLHAGNVYTKPAGNWDCDDLASLGIVVGANVVTPNGSSEGNCNLVDTGLGFNVIVPAAGDGTHDIVLADAFPIPARDEDGNHNGYWDLNEATGEVTASATPGSARYNLYDAEMTFRFVNEIPLGSQDVEFPTSGSEYIHPSWIMRVHANKQSDGEGVFSVRLYMYRLNVAI